VQARQEGKTVAAVLVARTAQARNSAGYLAVEGDVADSVGQMTAAEGSPALAAGLEVGTPEEALPVDHKVAVDAVARTFVVVMVVLALGIVVRIVAVSCLTPREPRSLVGP